MRLPCKDRQEGLGHQPGPSGESPLPLAPAHSPVTEQTVTTIGLGLEVFTSEAALP